MVFEKIYKTFTAILLVATNKKHFFEIHRNELTYENLYTRKKKRNEN